MSNSSRNQEGTFFLKAQVAQSMGDYLACLERYEEAREEYQQAIANYDRVTASDFVEAQKYQKIIRDELDKLPETQRSSEVFRFERLFAPSLESSTPQVNLSQWLQNTFEEGWQAIEQLFGRGESSFAYALRSQDVEPANPDEIDRLIELIHFDRDEIQQQQAVQRLREIGTGNQKAIATLVELIRYTSDDNTRWIAAESLWRIDSGNLAIGVRRVKEIQLESHTVGLMMSILPKVDQKIALLLRVYPLANQRYLPANLKLMVLDDKDNSFLEAKSKDLNRGERDLFIQLIFSGSCGEKFRVKLSHGEDEVREDFVI